MHSFDALFLNCHKTFDKYKKFDFSQFINEQYITHIFSVDMVSQETRKRKRKSIFGVVEVRKHTAINILL